MPGGKRENVSCTSGTWANLERKRSSGDRVSIELRMEVGYACMDRRRPKRVRSSTATVLVRRHQTLDSDCPSKFAPQDGNSFHLRLSGEEEFVTFYSIGFHEPYEMYFDLS